MKKFVAVTLLVVLSVIFGTAAADTGFYAHTAVIVEFNYDEDVVVVEDAIGFLWEFEGVEDYFVGDVVSMLMWNNGTESIFDDIILDVVYSGYQF